MDEDAGQQAIQGFLASLAQAGTITAAITVVSVDGRTTIGERVGGLTGPADQRMLLGAREQAVAIVVGGRTVRTEGYHDLLGAEAQTRRQANRLPAEPELVVFTRQSPALPELWRQLRERHPEGLIVCEGGPTLLGMAVERRLIDQLILCISPRIVGDDSELRLLNHEGPLDRRLELLATACSQGFLFLRYGLS